MSVTTPDLAAQVVADALIEAAQRSTSHRRLYLRAYLGIEPSDVFASLIERASETLALEPGGGEERVLRAVEVGESRLLIPYLVADGAGDNAGSQGFSAFLRDHFAAGAGSERRILLVLDQQPLDTVMTASEDAASLGELQWTSLCNFAERLQPEESEASDLLPTLVADFREHVPQQGDALALIAAFAATEWASAADAGDALHTLGIYIRDPEVGNDLGRRLLRSRQWRERLDTWSAPGQDLAKNLRRRASGSHPISSYAISQVMDAVGPFGIDYTAFTLDDLEAPEPPSPSFMRPIIVSGPAAFLKAGDMLGERVAPHLAAWYGEEGGELSVRLAGDFTDADSGEIRWTDGRISPVRIDANARVAEAAIEASEGWSFGTCVLERESSSLDELLVAVYVAAGTWFPAERRLLLDIKTGSFIVPDEPTVAAFAAGGRLLTPLVVSSADLDSETVIELPVETPDGETHVIPLLFLGEGDGGSDETDGADPDGDGDPDPPGTSLRARTVTHALLDYARRSEGPLPDPQFSAEGGLTVGLGGDIYEISTLLGPGLDGLRLEQEMFAQPESWAFVLRGRGDETQLLRDSALERLALGGIDSAAIQRFAAAREALFASLQEHGSVHAIAAGAARDEAAEYVDAYLGLLADIPSDSRYQAEFDRLVFMDAISVPEADEILLAPSNPATVAFLLAFSSTGGEWTGEDSQGVLSEDLNSVSPTFLTPLVSRDGLWYEAAQSQAFLWRRYTKSRETGSVAIDDAQAIAARLRFFLDVYPLYKNKEQTVAIAVHEPGDGTALVEALRMFYRDDLAQQRAQDYLLPKLDVLLVSASSVWPAAVMSLLAGGEGTSDLDRLVRSRIKVTLRAAAEDFRHLTFVFRTFRADPVEVDMDSRSTSLFVGALAAAPGRFFQSDANRYAFWWGTFAGGPAGSVAGGAAAEALPRISRHLLELVGAQPNGLLRPGHTKMLSVSVDREFMPETYQRSVWVVHLDHILGLEAFNPRAGAHERYLIDYQERGEAGRAGLSSVTATEQVEPYLDALTDALSELGEVSEPALLKLLSLLNSVSGYWALQLLRQSREQVLERIGMLAAAAVADQLDGAFLASDSGMGLLIPLEELQRSLERVGIPHPGSMLNDDYLIVRVPFAAPPGELLQLRGRLLEVKYRTSGRPDLAVARQEIENTSEHLRTIFNTCGPQRLFRSRDLAELLRTAHIRGTTFGLVDQLSPSQAASFEHALGRVSSGDFELAFRFWVGGDEYTGDVVSVELESDSGAAREELPGAGEPGGLVRLGRRVLASLASGQPIPQPSQAWTQPSFEPPEEPPSGTAREQEPEPEPPTPDGSHGEGETAADDATGGELEAEAAAARQLRAAGEVSRLAAHLDTAVAKYGLDLEPFQPALAQVGPSVIRFRARPLGSQSLDGVQRRAEDIGREIGVGEAVLVGQEPFYITIDIPRADPEVITFGAYRHLLDGEHEPGALDFLVGMAASGEVVIEDIARLPHLLVAGETGAGKSVFLRSLICSLLHTRTPDDLSILLIDPKQVDFLPFEDIPHLHGRRIIFDPAEAVSVLSETIGAELERRRPILKAAGVTSALEFYEAGGRLEELPQMVVIVDEFADLALTLDRSERDAFMSVIQRYGQLTRAFGIYLVLATQRPSVRVVTGDIKQNLTARVALKMQASQDSITILGHGGAESLRTKGDLLFEHGGRSLRLQGFFVTPDDLKYEIGRWGPTHS